MDKILYISYYWPPSGGPGVQRGLKFVKHLPALGYEPTVITVDEHYAEYQLYDQSLISEIPKNTQVIRTKTREPFKIYSKLFGEKNMPKPGFAGNSSKSIISIFGRFIRGNLFVPDARKGWNPFLTKEAIKQIKDNNIKAIITSSPPHSTHLAGLQIKKATGAKWIADMRDTWTDIYYYKDLYHLWFIKKLDKKYERQVLINADKIIVTSQGFKLNFLKNCKDIDASKIIVIPNGYDENDFNSKNKDINLNAHRLLYTGTMSFSYNIDALSNAVKALTNIEQIEIHFIGHFSEHICNQLKDSIGSRFITKPYMSHDLIVKELVEASSLLLTIPQTDNNSGIVPGKIFEYLAAGNPILGIGPPEGDAAKILEYCNAGKMFDYDDAEGIKGFLEEICHENFQFKPRLDRVAEFSRKMLTEKLAKELKKLIHP